ncbi:hypothetical protein B0H65DRAFT_545593 [Neurospora tetraspora]|uniref:Uncharacterized protein n=1 Tax=Neurospora tetraspora TaxID=94610 RepID=A0AAE0MU87_9PEZI|nr:hypothetical protein B0H65DRAFT_545593 [Neurospora tetraspora]
MTDFQTDDPLSQEELLCYKPADEIYHTYCKAGREQDLVVAVTWIIIYMLLILLVGIFLWVNTRGWDLPRSGSQKKRPAGDDVEGQAGYSDSDTEKGHGHGLGLGRDNTRSDPVEGFVEEIRRLAVEEKIPWEMYEVVERIRREHKAQAQGVREGSGGGDCEDTASTNAARLAQ